MRAKIFGEIQKKRERNEFVHGNVVEGNAIATRSGGEDLADVVRLLALGMRQDVLKRNIIALSIRKVRVKEKETERNKEIPESRASRMVSLPIR